MHKHTPDMPTHVTTCISLNTTIKSLSYPETLGVKPPAKDPHNFMASLGLPLPNVDKWYLSTGEFTWHSLLSRSISCSVHIVSADTALI